MTIYIIHFTIYSSVVEYDGWYKFHVWDTDNSGLPQLSAHFNFRWQETLSLKPGAYCSDYWLVVKVKRYNLTLPWWVSGSCFFCQSKPWLANWQPRHGLREGSRLGFVVLVLIRMAGCKQLWTYLVILVYWLTSPENVPFECRGLNWAQRI